MADDVSRGVYPASELVLEPDAEVVRDYRYYRIEIQKSRGGPWHIGGFTGSAGQDKAMLQKTMDREQARLRTIKPAWRLRLFSYRVVQIYTDLRPED